MHDDPIELLEQIKNNMYVPTRANYEFDALMETIQQFVVDTKQEDGKSLIDFTKCFKQSKDVFATTLGEHMLDEFIKKTAKYISETDMEKQKNMIDEGFNKWTMLLYLKERNQHKYGELMSDLNKQYTLGHSQYPKTLSKGVDTLNNHKWDYVYNKHKCSQNDQHKKTKEHQIQQGNNGDDGNSNDCQTMSEGRSFTQHDKRVCLCCGGEDHLIPDCPEKDSKQRSQWYMYRTLNTYQSNDISDNNNSGNGNYSNQSNNGNDGDNNNGEDNND